MKFSPKLLFRTNKPVTKAEAVSVSLVGLALFALGISTLIGEWGALGPVSKTMFIVGTAVSILLLPWTWRNVKNNNRGNNPGGA